MYMNQKAQNIAFALIRIAVYVRREELRHRIERSAFQLLEDVAAKNLSQGLSDIDVLCGLLSLGESIYEIEPINAKILKKELDDLNSEMRQFAGLGKEGDDLRSIFSQDHIAGERDGKNNGSSVSPRVHESEYGSVNGNGHRPNGNGNGNGISATIRQSAIIEKIRSP